MKRIHQIAFFLLILGVISFIFHLQHVFAYTVSRELSLEQDSLGITEEFTGLNFFGSWVYLAGAFTYCLFGLLKNQLARIVLTLIMVVVVVGITIVSVSITEMPMGPGVSDTYLE